MSTSSKPSTETSEIEGQIKVIREDISSLASLLKNVVETKASDTAKKTHDQAENLINRSREAADHATDRARQAAHSVEDYLAEKPAQSALIALLVGFFIGTLWRR